MCHSGPFKGLWAGSKSRNCTFSPPLHRVALWQLPLHLPYLVTLCQSGDCRPESPRNMRGCLFGHLPGTIWLPLCGYRQAPGQKHLVGFCFSFPCEQERLDRGKLIKWTKQFDNDGAVGEDPVKLLQEALHRKGLQVRLLAVLPTQSTSGSASTARACRWHCLQCCQLRARVGVQAPQGPAGGTACSAASSEHEWECKHRKGLQVRLIAGLPVQCRSGSASTARACR